jgi:SAM-dependent methyltransferase
MNILQLGLRDVETMLLPFRTIGHFTEFELRRKVFEQVWQSLRPGGRFVLDHYIPDPIWAKEVAGKSKIMFESPAGEENLRISDTYTFDIARGMMDCSVRVESSAAVAKVCTHDIEFDFAWVDTSEMREHALATQFKICATYGSFARAELTPTSTEQIWILQRPD